MPRVSLTKEFFVRHFHDEKSKRIDTFNGIELVSCWSLPFSIEEGVTFGDLLLLLKTADPSLITFIAMATNCNLEPFLNDTRPASKPGQSDYENLLAVEVAKYYELSNYDDIDTFVMHSDSSCSGLGKDEKGQDINYALEFTPWKELEPLPLRISNKSRLSKITWTKCEPHSVGTTLDGDDLLWKSDREFVSNDSTDILSTDMTLGEFFSCLLNELCFFGSPEDAAAQMGKLNEAFQSVSEEMEELERKKKREIN